MQEFANAILDKNKETFVIYMVFPANSNKSLEIFIYLSCKTQLALLIINKAMIAIYSKYSN